MQGSYYPLHDPKGADCSFSSPDLPLEVHIAAHLLDISRSHAVHRFFIEDESSTPRLFASYICSVITDS